MARSRPRALALARPLGAAVGALLSRAAAPPRSPDPRPQPTAPQRAPTTAITPQLQAELDAAMALVKAEQYEPAAEAFKKLALALPDSAIPAINLALIYKKLDKPDLAEAQLKQALAIEPDNPVAGNELALLYRKTGRFAEARTAYEKTLAKYPHFAMVHKNLGVLCDLYLKDYQCAIDHYKSYALSAPNDKSVQIGLPICRSAAARRRPMTTAKTIATACLLLCVGVAMAQDKAKQDKSKKPDEEAKEVSGMSIVGNSETPKSLTIIPGRARRSDGTPTSSRVC